MVEKLISIVTVSFNAASTIEKTIKSVGKHKSSRTEYIIIDGGSKDGTVDLIKKHSDGVDKWVSEPDKGIYDAMNKGVALASGEWILFLGADDLLCLNISEIEDNLTRDFTYYGNVELLSNSKIYDGKFGRYKILMRNICQQAIFYPVRLLRERRFNQKYKIAADYEMNLFLYGTQPLKLKYIDKVVSIFDDTGVSSKINDKVFRSDFIWLFFRYFPLYFYPMYFIALLNYYVLRTIFYVNKSIG